MVARCETPVLRLGRNGRGRDFVMGDCHGCYDQVVAAMRATRFDMGVDRILSVGDHVDRGPQPERAAPFLSQPFVRAVRGNHEDMLLEAYEDGDPHPAVIEYLTGRNGMGWWRTATPAVRTAFLDAARRLPIAIEVDTPRGRVGIVHADVPAGMDWATFLRRLEAGDEDVMQVALWGRDRIGRGDDRGVAGVDRLFVGHTPIRRAARFGNVYALDTGLVFGVTGRDAEAHLTFADVMADTLVLDGSHESAPPAAFVRLVTEARAAREGRPFSDLRGR